MGRKIDQDDIQGIARTVEEWLRSEQARRYLHGLLFGFYRDFKDSVIPDLIGVKTDAQKAVVVLAYYYHYRDPDNLSADSEARKQLLEEWPKSEVPDWSPNDEERPVPIAVGFQIFVDECSEVPNISPKGHQRVEKWVTEVAEACADATPQRAKRGPKVEKTKFDQEKEIFDRYEEARMMGKDITRAEFAQLVGMKEKDFKRLYDRVYKRLNPK